MPGVPIVDNIQESMESSRKVVLIVTNAFASSEWCQSEFAWAQFSQFSEAKFNSLILVVKERIHNRNMSPRLARQMKTQTYIEWKETESEQKLFWARLATVISGSVTSVAESCI